MEMLVKGLIDIAMFAAQAVVIVAALIVLLGFVFNLIQKGKHKQELEVEDLNKRYKNFGLALQAGTLSKKEFKARKKAEKAEKKDKKKEKEKKQPHLSIVDVVFL